MNHQGCQDEGAGRGSHDGWGDLGQAQGTLGWGSGRQKGVAASWASLGSFQLGFPCVSLSLDLPDVWLRNLLTLE